MKVLWFANNPCEAIESLTNQDVRTVGWLYTLCQHLRKQTDIELHIAFMWGVPIETFVYKGVTYHPILRKGTNTRIGRYWYMLRGQFSDRSDKEELRSCMRVVDELKPDIIHVHGTEDMFGLICQSGIRIPVVLSIQGLLTSCRIKYYSGLSRCEITTHESIRKKFLMSGYNGLYRNLNRRAEREIKMFRHVKYVIGRTDWDRRCAVALNPSAVYFKVNEIMRAEFMNAVWARNNISESIKLVTTISSGTFKGLETIYQTARLLKINNLRYEWYVIGIAEDDEMIKIVEKHYSLQAKELNIKLLGSKPADDMVRIMLSSDIYVQVSHIENSPNSLCEAMMIGMPIIASFAGGTSSILKNGVEGVLIQDGNSYELAGAIIEAMRNYSHIIAMGENARKSAIERHNPDNVLREMLRVYKELLSDGEVTRK